MKLKKSINVKSCLKNVRTFSLITLFIISIISTSTPNSFGLNPPLSQINIPANGSKLYDLDSISGVVSTDPSLNINNVNITIQRLDDNKYWDGILWRIDKTWLVTSLSNNNSTWSYDSSSVIWGYGDYSIKSKAADSGGNIQSPANQSIFKFAIRPVSTILDPINGSKVSTLTDVSGTGVDYSGTGLKLVNITLKRLADNKYWDSSNWVNTETWLTCSGTYSWTYTSLPLFWENGNYLIKSRAEDWDNNVEIPGPGNTFTFDNKNPISNVLVPANGAYLNSLPEISGTASDPEDDLTKVKITIQRLSDNKYWTGSSWVIDESWLWAGPDPTLETWVYDTGLPAWKNGDYRIRSRAEDGDANVEVPGPGNIFTFDNVDPVSQIDVPADGSKINYLPTISGTAADSDSGVQKVEIKIRRLSDFKFWDGVLWITSDWSASNTWLPVTGTTSWSFGASSVQWDNGDYRIKSRATDRAGNVETPSVGNSFTFAKPPISIIVTPADGSKVSSLAEISGTAASYSGFSLKEIKITLKRLADNKYWDGSNWVNTETWLLATGTTSWTYTSLPLFWENGNYLIKSRAEDWDNNVEIPGPGNTFTFDNKNPISNVLVPANGAYLNSLPEISGTASDPEDDLTKVKITIQRLSDDQYWTGIGWDASEIWLWASPDPTWETWVYDTGLPAWENGDYRIRSRAEDGDANVEVPGPGNIFTFDDIPPISQIDVPADGDTLTSLNVISGIASDSFGSGVEKVEIKIRRDSDTKFWDGILWISDPDTWFTASGTTAWEFDSSNVTWTNGDYTIKSRATDRAGNVETPSAGNTFTFVSLPSSIIIYPEDGAKLNSLTEIYGNATDNSGSGLARVRISIERLSDNKYWDGTSWVVTEIWRESTTLAGGPETYTWTYDVSTIVWNNTDYLVRSRAEDNDGNIEIPGPGNIFTFDDIAPISLTVWSPTHPDPDQSYPNDDPIFQWIASDPSGIGGYSYIFDQHAATIPDLLSEGMETSKSYFDIAEGGWWFHVRAVDEAGNWGSPEHFRITINFTDFILSISPSKSLIFPGHTTTFNINISSIGGFESVVDLSIAGLPQKAQAQFDPESVSVPANSSAYSTLTIATEPGVYRTTYNLLVSAVGSPYHSEYIMLNIGDFEVTVSPDILPAKTGSTVTYAATIKSLADFDETVLLDVSGWEDHSLGTESVTPLPGGSTSTFLTLSVPSDAPPALYNINLSGTSGNQTHFYIANLKVTLTPDFALSVYPNIKEVARGSSADFNITLASINGFNNPVDLSLSSLPTNVTGRFSSDPMPTLDDQITSSTLLVTVSDSATEGIYSFDISATSGSMVYKYPVDIVITEPSETPPFPPVLPDKCIIATATYGSELSPEVSLLRGFRDNTVMSTFAGRQFMSVFNAWYYSFSPPVAGAISDSTVVKPIMRAVLYPLIGILHIASQTNSAMSAFGSEIAIVAAGLVASALIGIVYLAPISLLILFAFRRYYRVKISSYTLHILAGLVMSSGVLLLIGEFMTMTYLVMFSAAMLIVTTLALSGIAFVRFVAQSLKF